MDIEKIIKDFSTKYSDEEYYTKDIGTKVNNWLDNADRQELRVILLKLFNEFQFFSKLEIKKNIKRPIKQSP